MAAVLLPGFRLQSTRRPTAAAALKLGNTKLLGIEVYTRYLLSAQIAAVMLLVAIIAAISLTLRARKDSKRIDPSRAGQGEEGRPRPHRLDEARAGAARCAERRRQAGGRPPMTLGPVTLGHYLVARRDPVRASSVIGIFLNRKNLIVLLMAIELMLLAVNLNFVAFSHYLGDMAGPGVRVLHPHRRRRRIGDRPGDPGRAVPRPARRSPSTSSTR